MPVTQQSPKNNYTGNGSTTVFAYTFKILTSSDLKVYIDGVLQVGGYSVSNVGVGGGGNVTFTTAPAINTSVILVRVLSLDRTTDYVEGGALPAAVLDDDFDRTIMMIQDVRADSPSLVAFETIVNTVNTNTATAVASATTATTQAGIATTQAGIATTQAGIATTQATTSTTQAGIATTQASSATASASTATTQAGIATTQAGIATTQAGIATTQASNASTSATTALAAQTAAESARDATFSSLDSFDDRYLGPKASNPTLDNDGFALLAGALYFNTTDGEMRVYTGTVWVSAYTSGLTLVSKYGDSMSGALRIGTIADDGVNMLQVTGGAAVTGNVASGGYALRSVGTGISAAGTTQGTATALTKDFNGISTVAAGSGVVLPTAASGMTLIVLNLGANALNVYPASGASIDSGAADAAMMLPAGAKIMYIAMSSTQWYTLNATYA